MQIQNWVWCSQRPENILKGQGRPEEIEVLVIAIKKEKKKAWKKEKVSLQETQ